MRFGSLLHIPAHATGAGTFSTAGGFDRLHELLAMPCLTEARPDLAAEWDHQRNSGLSPDRFRTWSRRTVAWHCRAGHTWTARIVDRTRGEGCWYC